MKFRGRLEKKNSNSGGDVYKKKIQIPGGDVYENSNSNSARGRL